MTYLHDMQYDAKNVKCQVKSFTSEGKLLNFSVLLV